MIVALAGGVGGAKLARGLAQVLGADELLIAVNIADDFEHLGLHISPDLDTVMYTLADRNNSQTGWGIAGETWHFMEALERLGGDTWFLLGDQDLATHVERTRRLRSGEGLASITASLSSALGVKHRIVPASEDAVRTFVETDAGVLAFQDYFVRRKSEPKVSALRYEGASGARPSAALLEAFNAANLEAIVICPSNPFLSIHPMLAIPGVADAIRRRRVPCVAVSPIVGGAAVKGPTAKIMRELDMEPSAFSVADLYRGFLDGFVIDDVDRETADRIEALGLQVLTAPIVVRNKLEQEQLAATVVHFARLLAGQPGVGRRPSDMAGKPKGIAGKPARRVQTK
jgi:LPPG:FO 2-phospho-L-lactate transferase